MEMGDHVLLGIQWRWNVCGQKHQGSELIEHKYSSASKYESVLLLTLFNNTKISKIFKICQMCSYQLRPLLNDYTLMIVVTQNILPLFCLCSYDCEKMQISLHHVAPNPLKALGHGTPRNMWSLIWPTVFCPYLREVLAYRPHCASWPLLYIFVRTFINRKLTTPFLSTHCTYSFHKCMALLCIKH